MLRDPAGDSGGSSVLKNILSPLMKATNLISGLSDSTSQPQAASFGGVKCGSAPAGRGLGGTALELAAVFITFKRCFPALSDLETSLCFTGMRSLRGRSQHSKADVMLHLIKGDAAFCGIFNIS